jgi:DNA-directed RNA polymerase subunit H (RpoH/RPB5)
MSSYKLQINLTEKKMIILKNILSMLKTRKIVTSVEKETYLKLFEKNVKISDIFILEKNKIKINIISSNINSINKGSPLEDFLLEDINYHKIIVVPKLTKKIVKQIRSTVHYNAEIFNEYELLEDISKKVFIPKHILLTNEEKDNILKTYSYSELSKIFDTDMMARYYLMKPNDIVKIIRPSINSGEAIFYRHVVPGKNDLMV